MTISITPGKTGLKTDNIITAELTINTIEQDGEYSGHEVSLIVVDDDGNVVEK